MVVEVTRGDSMFFSPVNTESCLEKPWSSFGIVAFQMCIFLSDLFPAYWVCCFQGYAGALGVAADFGASGTAMTQGQYRGHYTILS